MIELENTFSPTLYRSVKIKSIKKINNTDFVYDLTVKEKQTYCVLGDQYLIGHNSDMGKQYCSLAA